MGNKNDPDIVSDNMVAFLSSVSLDYGDTRALDDISLEIPSGKMIGFIGPDGVGKSTLFSLIAGARRIQDGTIKVMGGDMSDARHRRSVCSRIAYMPQGLGKNLYATLSVFENLDFFGALFGHDQAERNRRIDDLLDSTGLAPFRDRPAGKLSGGMKQKLGLCCALIHDPDLLILDEPTTGVDPLSRAQFWTLIARIRAGRLGMSVIVATAYMEEAARFDWLAAMSEGKVLATGTPKELLEDTGQETLEEAFIQLLPENERREHQPVHLPPRATSDNPEIAIESRGLTKKFGDFTAVDSVDFRIERGEIFGFLGSNGCGKSTTMKMLTGLLPATEGTAWLFGSQLEPDDIETRRKIGYMSQAFSLYSELTVQQNLELHAKLYSIPEDEREDRVKNIARRFGIEDDLSAYPNDLPLGVRQRLSLAVAMIHKPAVLILDEPTSGVDPVARDDFWRMMIEISRRDQVTIFISTHFMNEAERCDRISLMHAGKVLVSGTPENLITERKVETLEEAFILWLSEAANENLETSATALEDQPAPVTQPASLDHDRPGGFSLTRLASYVRREALELAGDPIRGTMALVGSVILMFIMGFGISMDVQDLTFAVLDRDDTAASRDYTLNLSGSRYFIEQPPITDYADMDKRMRSGKLTFAVELPPGFARDIARGRPAEVGLWMDGSMPQRGETIQSYMSAMHMGWLAQKQRELTGNAAAGAPANVEVRFRYNPDVKSLVSMVPAVIPMLLLMIPAMLTALSVVREKELGSIVNLYVTPVTKLEFLIGKQIPYVLLGMVNFFLLTLLAVTAFGVPLTGSFLVLTLGAFLFIISSTAMGLLISSFMRSQIAAIFGTTIATMLPAVQFSGMLNPVSSLEGAGAVIGKIYPATHFLNIARGTFSKSLGYADLSGELFSLAASGAVLLALCVLVTRKQAT